MNYCSIDDAWGVNNRKTEHFSAISNENKAIVPVNQPVQKLSQMPVNHNMMNCPDAFYHIINCQSCNHKMRNLLDKPKTNILGTIENAIEDNKDLIVLVLTGASIVLFFNLINNITKD